MRFKISTVTHFDLLIIGGGLVGCALALALSEKKLKIGVLENKPWTTSKDESFTDVTAQRTLALSFSSYRILQSLGVWELIEPFAQPVRQVHVSSSGHFGAARILAEDHSLPSLGYVLPSNVLLANLQQKLLAKHTIQCMSEARWLDLQPLSQPNTAHYSLKVISSQGEPQTIHTQLLIAADGSDSPIRQALGINVQSKIYSQQALIGVVTLTSDHQGIAYERFTKNGAVALLPLRSDPINRYRCAFVWTVDNKDAEGLKRLTPSALCHEVQKAFGHRLGRFQTITQLGWQPLRSQWALEQIRPGLVLLGNAAHTLHPIAAQGLNMGLKDMAVLAQILVESTQKNTPLGDLTTLQKYLSWRSQEQKNIRLFTESLLILFADSLSPVILARNMALCGLDRLTPLKRQLATLGMGLYGRLPRLACGMKL